MFLIYDEKHLIAMSDEKKIAKKYIDNLEFSHHETSGMYYVKVKDKDQRVKNNEELILVRYGDTYVQKGFLPYIEMADDQVILDEEYCIDILKRLIEVRSLNKKDMKILTKAIMLLDKYCCADALYTPSIQELRNFKEMYDPYLYKFGRFIK